MSKPKPIAVNGAFSLLPPYDKYTSYRIEWNNKAKRRTDGLSTRTTDLQTAQEIFSRHHLANTPGGADTQAKDEHVAQTLARYFIKHASNLPSVSTARAAMDSANEQFKDKLVSQIDATQQQEWITALRARGIADSTITRWLKVVWAAFNYAVVFKHLTKTAIPERLEHRHWGERVVAPKRITGGDSARRELTVQELGALCDATRKSENGLRFFILALGTGGRPAALRHLTVSQFDLRHGILDLNPVGRVQNDKYHPRIAVAPILAAWLDAWSPRTAAGHYLGGAGGKPICAKQFFRRYIVKAKIPDCVIYTLRHTVASWLAGHGVPKWQRSQFMGHARPDGNTTDDYSHSDPKYLRECATAIQALFEAVAPHTQVNLMRRNLDEQPTPCDGGQSVWLERFLDYDGHRLVGVSTPEAPPVRAPGLIIIPTPQTGMIAAPARSTAGADPLNRAFPTPTAESAWRVHGADSQEQ